MADSIETASPVHYAAVRSLRTSSEVDVYILRNEPAAQIVVLSLEVHLITCIRKKPGSNSNTKSYRTQLRGRQRDEHLWLNAGAGHIAWPAVSILFSKKFHVD